MEGLVERHVGEELGLKLVKEEYHEGDPPKGQRDLQGFEPKYQEETREQRPGKV